MKHILTGRELLEWIRENDLLLKFSSVEEASIVLNNYLNVGYALDCEGDKLIQVYSDQEGTYANNITIDEVIDIAAENAYEEKEILKEELSRTNFHSILDIVNYAKGMKRLVEKSNESKAIGNVYKQTIYGKEMLQQIDQMRIQYEMDQRRREEKMEQSLKEKRVVGRLI